MKTDIVILEPTEAGPADRVYVISFPKSGRTWLRVLLSRYKQKLLAIDEFELKLHGVSSDGDWYAPRFIFSHAKSDYINSLLLLGIQVLGRRFSAVHTPSLTFDLSPCRESRIIFLIRDPRDTVVSYYHQLSKRRFRNRIRFRQSMSEFVRDKYLGIDRIIAFMNFIAAEKDQSDHLFISYEEMHQGVRIALESILRFASMDIVDEYVRDSIEYASFANMKRMEALGRYGDKLSPGDLDDPNAYKVRKGKIGSYAEELSPEDVDYIEQRIADGLDDFYPQYKQT